MVTSRVSCGNGSFSRTITIPSPPDPLRIVRATQIFLRRGRASHCSLVVANCGTRTPAACRAISVARLLLATTMFAGGFRIRLFRRFGKVCGFPQLISTRTPSSPVNQETTWPCAIGFLLHRSSSDRSLAESLTRFLMILNISIISLRGVLRSTSLG